MRTATVPSSTLEHEGAPGIGYPEGSYAATLDAILSNALSELRDFAAQDDCCDAQVPRKLLYSFAALMIRAALLEALEEGDSDDTLYQYDPDSGCVEVAGVVEGLSEYNILVEATGAAVFA